MLQAGASLCRVFSQGFLCRWAGPLQKGPHLGHLGGDDLLDARQLLRLQRRAEAGHLEGVQLRVAQHAVLHACKRGLIRRVLVGRPPRGRMQDSRHAPPSTPSCMPVSTA